MISFSVLQYEYVPRHLLPRSLLGGAYCFGPTVYEQPLVWYMHIFIPTY